MAKLNNEVLFTNTQGERFTLDKIVKILKERKVNALVEEDFDNNCYSKYICVIEEIDKEEMTDTPFKAFMNVICFYSSLAEENITMTGYYQYDNGEWVSE